MHTHIQISDLILVYGMGVKKNGVCSHLHQPSHTIVANRSRL